jgi:hypothetical protein
MPPTVVAVGTVDSASAGGYVPGLPTGWAQDDILMVLVEQTGGEASPSSAGYAHVTGSPSVQGVNTQLSVLWKRATASESAPTIAGPVDHGVTRMIAVRGCPTTGNPWNIAIPANSATSSTAASWPGGTTTTADCLMLECIATGADIGSVQFAANITNGAYSNIVKQMDNWVITGGGGGIGLFSATMATAGATGASAGTLTTAATKAYMTIAMAPAIPGPTRYRVKVSTQAVHRRSRW